MQVNGSTSKALQFQLAEAARQQNSATVEHLRQVNSKVEQTKESVLENAVQQANRSAEVKGRLIDVVV